MRSFIELQSNIHSIKNAMDTIKSQIEILENEYQINAVSNLGEPYDIWNLISERLNIAWKDLNYIMHMELDQIDYIKYGED